MKIELYLKMHDLWALNAPKDSPHATLILFAALTDADISRLGNGDTKAPISGKRSWLNTREFHCQNKWHVSGHFQTSSLRPT